MRFIYFVTFLLILSCKSGNSDSVTDTPDSATNTPIENKNTSQNAERIPRKSDNLPADPQNKAHGGGLLPSIPDETMQKLLSECDYVDIIFYDLPISVSQEEADGIRNSINFISKPVAGVNPDCKPVGRISYMIKGIIEAEADFYYSPDCASLIFIENGKPIYGNVLSKVGADFFRVIMSQIPQ